MAQTREERYQEWLERMEIPVYCQEDIETFKEYLREEFGITRESQIEALWSAVDIERTLRDYGIRPVLVEYPWGEELRYGVKGKPGLWGWRSVREMMEEMGAW